MTQLGSRAANVTGVDIVMWYNLTTFDIIGSLAFGESFGGVRSGREFTPDICQYVSDGRLGFARSLDLSNHQSDRAERPGGHDEPLSIFRYALQIRNAQVAKSFD